MQNAVNRRDMGVATSSATFTRQIGGTLGTAVFLSILFSQAGCRISEAFQSASTSPEFLAALKNPTGGNAAVNQQFVERIQASQSGGGGAIGTTALQDSSFINQLDPRLARPFLVGFSDAMSTVFLVASAILVLALIATLFLPSVELSNGPADPGRPGGPRGGRRLRGRRGRQPLASPSAARRSGRSRTTDPCRRPVTSRGPDVR